MGKSKFGESEKNRFAFRLVPDCRADMKTRIRERLKSMPAPRKDTTDRKTRGPMVSSLVHWSGLEVQFFSARTILDFQPKVCGKRKTSQGNIMSINVGFVATEKWNINDCTVPIGRSDCESVSHYRPNLIRKNSVHSGIRR